MVLFDTGVLFELRRKKLEELERRRVEFLERIVPEVRRYFSKIGVSEAYIFGSVLRPYAFGPRSDVDFAVSGLKSDLLEVMKDLEEITGRNVDVVELEKLRSAEIVRKRGLKVV